VVYSHLSTPTCVIQENVESSGAAGPISWEERPDARTIYERLAEANPDTRTIYERLAEANSLVDLAEPSQTVAQELFSSLGDLSPHSVGLTCAAVKTGTSFVQAQGLNPFRRTVEVDPEIEEQLSESEGSESNESVSSNFEE
jgi:hypothetical protein